MLSACNGGQQVSLAACALVRLGPIVVSVVILVIILIFTVAEHQRKRIEGACAVATAIEELCAHAMRRLRRRTCRGCLQKGREQSVMRVISAGNCFAWHWELEV